MPMRRKILHKRLVRAFTRLETFRGDSRFSSWLYMVCSNCIRMHLRTKRRKGALNLDDHIHDYESSESTSGNSPDRAAERVQLFDAIGSAMSQLPPQYGSILDLWVYEGLDLNEIKERSGRDSGD